MATKNPRVKIVIVGDSAIGKSCFLLRWKTNIFTVSYDPGLSLYHEYKADVLLDGKAVSTSAWYTCKSWYCM